MIASVVVFSLFMCFSLSAGDKGKPWLADLIELIKPHRGQPEASLTGRRGLHRGDMHLDIAIHNINTHQQKVAALRYQGLSEFEIQACIDAGSAVAGSGFISGTVTEKSGARIQSHATVYAYNEFGRYCGYDCLLPNANPRYEIKNLPPGKYYLRVISDYYHPVYYRNSNDWKKGKLVRVNKNRATRNINFKLNPYTGKSSVMGQVRRKDKTPVMDCAIYVYDLEWNIVKFSKTDAEGKYMARDLPGGDYKLLCEYLEGDVSMQIWYGNAISYEDASIVSLTDGEDLTGIDFVLEDCGMIEGKILGANGRPIRAYECAVQAYDMNENAVRSASTDDKGEFSLPALPKGRYRLKFTYYGQENNLSCWYKNARKFKAAVPVSVIPFQKKKVSVKLKPGGIITGKVVDFNGQPLEHYYWCAISVYNEGYGYVKYGSPEQSGFFMINGLETGRYKLYAEYEDYTYEPGPKPASEWYGGKNFFHEAPFVKVTAPKTRANINFSLEQGGSITGKVVLPRGTPIDYEGTVYAYNKMFENVGSCDFGAYYGSSGSYEVGGLPSGEYKLMAVYWGDEDYEAEWFDNKPNFGTAGKVSVTAPNTTGNIDLTLNYGGKIQGFVTDGDNNRLTEDRHFVQVGAFDALTGEFADSEVTSFTGGYQLVLLGGKYKIAAVSYGGNMSPASDDFAVTFHPDGESYDDPQSKTYATTAGSSAKIKSMVMKRTPGSIAGTIRDKRSGLPLTSGAYLVLVFDTQGYMAGISAWYEYYGPLSGEYRIKGLRPGQYYVLAVGMGEELGDYSRMPVQWYGGVELSLEDRVFIMPKMIIPAGALTVAVGTGATEGIDFYLKLPKNLK